MPAAVYDTHTEPSEMVARAMERSITLPAIMASRYVRTHQKKRQDRRGLRTLTEVVVGTKQIGPKTVKVCKTAKDVVLGVGLLLLIWLCGLQHALA